MRARLLVGELSVQGLFAISASRLWAARLNLPTSVQSTSQFKLDSQALAAPDPDTWTVAVTTDDLATTGPLLAAKPNRLPKTPTPSFQTEIAASLAEAAIARGTSAGNRPCFPGTPAEMRLGSLKEVP